MNLCQRCGSETFPDDTFCGVCGYNLSVLMETGTICSDKQLNAQDMRANLGILYFKQGKYELAIQNFEKVLQLNPNNVMIRQMLDEAQSAQKES